MVLILDGNALNAARMSRKNGPFFLSFFHFGWTTNRRAYFAVSLSDIISFGFYVLYSVLFVESLHIPAYISCPVYIHGIISGFCWPDIWMNCWISTVEGTTSR